METCVIFKENEKKDEICWNIQIFYLILSVQKIRLVCVRSKAVICKRNR